MTAYGSTLCGSEFRGTPEFWSLSNIYNLTIRTGAENAFIAQKG